MTQQPPPNWRPPNQGDPNQNSQFPPGMRPPSDFRPGMPPQQQQRPPLSGGQPPFRPIGQPQMPQQQRPPYPVQQQPPRPMGSLPPQGQMVQPPPNFGPAARPNVPPNVMRPPMPFQPQPQPPMQELTTQMGTMHVNDVSPSQKRRVYPGQTSPQGNQMPFGQPPTMPAQQQPMPQQFAPQPQQPMMGQPTIPQQFGQPPPPQQQPQFGQQPPIPQQQFQPAPQQAFTPGGPAFGQRPPMPGQPQPPKPKIDPDQIPSPVVGQQQDQETWNTVEYRTSSDVPPPLASSDYTSIDDGNAGPRHVRATSTVFPCTSDLANTCQLPLALIIQPFAQLKATENPVPVVNLGDKGPIRCNRCRAYVNPFFQWVNGGRKFVCNICEFTNDTPDEYFCPLDQNGYRIDWAEKPEIRFGVCDFTATPEFCSRKPVPANFVFVVDVSYQSIQNGILNSFVEALKEILDYFPVDEDQEESQCRFGLITFDGSLHFYNLNPALNQPQMMVVSDVSDPFVPLSTGFLVNPHESKNVIDQLMNQILALHSNPKPGPESCFGAAVKAAQLALKDTGGRIICMNSMLPTVGQGLLKNRDDPKIINTDTERQLYLPQDDYYKRLADDCVNSGASVDVFSFPYSYVDLASCGVLAALTGGRTYVYQRFHQTKDGLSFAQDFQRAVTRSFAYDALLRVRCGNGLRVHEHFGNFSMKNSTDIDLPLVDSETAFAVQFKHDGQLNDQKSVYFQLAMLYTSSFGQRRIRVINLALKASMQLGQVFKNADVDTILNFLSKAVISQITSTPLKGIRDMLTERCIQILCAYRKCCASTSPPGQLILPDSLKLYPIYTLSALKTKAFRFAHDIHPDVRVAEMRNLRSMSVSTTINLFYPKLFSLHDLPADSCDYNQTNKFVPPIRHRTSWDKIQADGIFLLENTRQVFVWVGASADSKLLKQLFGVDNIQQINPEMRVLPRLDNELSVKVRALLYYVQEEDNKAFYAPLQIVRQGEQTEMYFRSLLVEDDNHENMNYVDYLCFVHRQIQQLLTE